MFPSRARKTYLDLILKSPFLCSQHCQTQKLRPNPPFCAPPPTILTCGMQVMKGLLCQFLYAIQLWLCESGRLRKWLTEWLPGVVCAAHAQTVACSNNRIPVMSESQLCDYKGAVRELHRGEAENLLWHFLEGLFSVFAPQQSPLCCITFE